MNEIFARGSRFRFCHSMLSSGHGLSRKQNLGRPFWLSPPLRLQSTISKMRPEHYETRITSNFFIRKAASNSSVFRTFARRQFFSRSFVNRLIVNGSQHYTSQANFRPMPPPQKKSAMHLLLRILKYICLVTGISVWAILLVVLFMVDELKLDKSDQHGISSTEPWSLMRNLKFLGMVENDQCNDLEATLLSYSDEKVRAEISEKLNAFQELWLRLRDEEGIQLSLGSPVELCGYKCCQDEEHAGSSHCKSEDKKIKWKANCYVEGSKGVAVLQALFERHHTESDWVATKVHLEKIGGTGEVVCDVSSSLPNGLNNFTRLSDA